ncbi:hypothetical protein UO65_1447 [Actinokineospora spheciospongiae]|uniref:Uncharacterized protein n=1 Tax=Actinokineospora spheciospongiae TaxID=909613 RepID=W7ISB0_9PSEU|nr:hypothetical protein [Actinokineospora spheciospongiae]EWC63233.1 hypothetical protein UO65_1447 [Actinokineospora spheciospongiae]PWW66936.1 hypothetical protein DFQ13_101454 [Actinokineospora spheciospongiae]
MVQVDLRSQDGTDELRVGSRSHHVITALDRSTDVDAVRALATCLVGRVAAAFPAPHRRPA